MATLSVWSSRAGAAQGAADFGGQELTVLTWTEYLDPELVSEFEAKFNGKISFIYYESDDDRTELLAKNDGRGYDLILVSGLDLSRYVKRGWLAPLDEGGIPNREHLNRRWASAFPNSKDYAVPYFWGSLGIAYRTDLIGYEVTSWQQLLNPRAPLHGKIAMFDAARDLIGAALKTLGYSLNSDDLDQLRQAERLLAKQMPAVATYSFPPLTEDAPLVTGDVWISMMYSGDALMLQEHNENIAYVLPEEGGNLWVDYWAVARTSQRKELASAFLNFLNEPEVAARNAEFVYYATPNKSATAFLPEAFLEDPIIYPTPENLANSEFYRPLRARSQKLVNSIMASLMNGRMVNTQ